MSRNLVVAAVGDESLHRQWRSGASSFDLFLVYYGSGGDRYADECDHYLRLRGQKWHLVHHALTERPDVLASYEAFWIPDDDLAISGHDVDALFEVFHQYQLRMAQPAIALGRHMSHPICAERPGLLLRYTRFVEIQAPIFARDALTTVLPTFVDSRSGWGLDLVWPRLLGDGGIAIVDAYPVRHTRGMRSAGPVADEDVVSLVRRYGVGERPDVFAELGSVTLREAHRPLLAARRHARAAAYRSARPLIAPLLRRLRR